MSNSKQIITQLLASAGITVNGAAPYDIRVNNKKFFSDVLSGGSLALGESYMDQWWDCADLAEFFHRIFKSSLDTGNLGLKNLVVPYLRTKFLNRQKSKAYNIGRKHYDLGNDLFIGMLDKNMQYSCGFWKTAKTLDEAQLAKMDLVCRKLFLQNGESLLDIGCGWGGLLKYAVENYSVSGVGITVSQKQQTLARERCAGLPIEIRLEDYRKTTGKFDKIVSVGMLEHVGYKNYKSYMKVVHSMLKSDGLFLLHTIGSKITDTRAGDPWIDKYIFPDGKLPSLEQLAHATEGLFITEDLQNFGTYYQTTLQHWRENFIRSWPELSKKYDERFYRMWIYYLSLFTGNYEARRHQLWQIVYSKDGREKGYEREL